MEQEIEKLRSGMKIVHDNLKRRIDRCWKCGGRGEYSGGMGEKCNQCEDNRALYDELKSGGHFDNI